MNFYYPSGKIMPFSSIVLGQCPANEKPVQTGSERYTDRQCEQCHQFIRLIRRHFGEEPAVSVGPPPAGAFLRIRSFHDDHDRIYFQVVLFYEATDPDSEEYAERLDLDMPMNWDKPYYGKES